MSAPEPSSCSSSRADQWAAHFSLTQPRSRPSPAKEVVAFAPAPATWTRCLQALFYRWELNRRASTVVARGRACPQVPVGSENVPVSYPRDADRASRKTTKRPICRVFVKPSDGLEPSTPSLPWRSRGGAGGHRRALAITFLLQIELLPRVDRARACTRVPTLMYPSRTRDALPVLVTENARTRRLPARGRPDLEPHQHPDSQLSAPF